MTTNPRASTEFDLRRALINEQQATPIFAPRTFSLHNAVAGKVLRDDTRVLVMEREGAPPLVFVTVQLAYHHVLHGEHNGVPWMVSFCLVCNAGAQFNPMVNGRVLHFQASGMYNGMTLLADVETNSYWHHITGKCLYGTLKGAELKQLGELLHTTAGNVLAASPDAELIYSTLAPEEQKQADYWERLRQERKPDFPPEVFTGIVKEDTRLPRLDLGLGVWAASTHRYYPFTRLNLHNNKVFDSIDGRGVLIYVDPASGYPSAIYTSATAADWHDDVLALNSGETIRLGVVFDHNGTAIPVTRPQQMFVRWYGFAFTFPDCEIYTA